MKANSIVAVFVVVFSCVYVSGQDWRLITPLKSKCGDVRRTLGVKKCSYPVSRFEFPKFRVIVEFSDARNQWRVPRGTVVEVSIIFDEFVPLQDIGFDLSEFERRPVEDMPNASNYINKKKGIELTVQRVTPNEAYVSSIGLSPPRLKKK